MSPMPVWVAASISMTSSERSSAMAMQLGQTPQGSGVGPPLAVRAGAVQAPGDDPRRGGLADAADAGEHEGMGDAARGEGVPQRAHHRLLADQVGQACRAIAPGENPVGGWLGRAQRAADGMGRRKRKTGERPGAELVTAASFRT